MSEPKSKRPKVRSVLSGTTMPLGTSAEADTAGPALIERGDDDPPMRQDYETEDPFRFGWHHIDPDLLKELAEKPLQRLDAKDKVTTVPPGLGEGQEVTVEPDQGVAATSQRIEPPTATTHPTTSPDEPRRRGPRLALAAVGMTALVGGVLWSASPPSERSGLGPKSDVGTASENGDSESKAPGSKAFEPRSMTARATPPPQTTSPQDEMGEGPSGPGPSDPTGTSHETEEPLQIPPAERRARPASPSTSPSRARVSASTPSPAETSSLDAPRPHRPEPERRAAKAPARTKTSSREIDIETPITGL